MPALDSSLRNRLSRVVLAARKAAEKGAREALEALAVSHSKPHGSMGEAQKKLRNSLRAHGRQLGDRRDPARGTQAMDRLVQECAYAHWHRMLFVRFLAENQLLVEPESGVTITLGECKDLAREAGKDPWEEVSRFAQHMLPQIFRPEDPVLKVHLPPETRRELERLLESLPASVFTAADSLGWTYQYWQSARKKEVNESGVKIGAEELPAVTQLFTEHYMVLFLLHNTLGAWWAGKILADRPELLKSAPNEEELRAAVAIPCCSFEYLRFVRDRDANGREGPWRIGAGPFETWPRRAKDLKVLDPCCGSGHFLLSTLGLLARLRMEEEGLDLQEALAAVLRENLFGLELDARCTQIAAFSVALYCWQSAGKVWELPPLNIACCGLSVGTSRKEWLALAGEDDRLRGVMEHLYGLFQEATVLGSLIDPQRTASGPLSAFPVELLPLLDGVLARAETDAEREAGIAAQGMVEAIRLLLGTYTLVLTNPPYLGRGQQGKELIEFADKHEKDAKKDLATMFLSRALRWVRGQGTVAMVLPQNWLFLTSYKKLRERLLRGASWNTVVRLGEHAFESTEAAGAFASLVTLSALRPAEDHRFLGIDASANRGEAKIPPHQKARILAGEDNPHREATCGTFSQSAQLGNVDAVLSLVSRSQGNLLQELGVCVEGLSTGDMPRFVLKFWEIPPVSGLWSPFIQNVDKNTSYGGRSDYLRWSMGKGDLVSSPTAHNFPPSRVDGIQVLGNQGIRITQMNRMAVTLYDGEIFGKNGGTLVLRDLNLLPAVWCYCQSEEYVADVRAIDQSLAVTVGAMVKVPFDQERWQEVAAEKYPNGLPEPQSDDPTQWLFHGHPARAEPATALQVAVGRLLGYRWPPELDPDMRLAAEAREWVARCEELNAFADEDGIVCLSATRGERSAADRLGELLAAAFGLAWSAAKERELLAAASNGKKPADSLETWLRDRFFAEHCKLFHHRPFVWHLWDGNKHGFHCLVNAHKLTGPQGEGHRTLEKITWSYLTDWIERQRADQEQGKEGADARLAAALDLKAQLARILEGEQPYDLFVRWKPLHQQALGWDPDINDGVRLNIRPFMKAELRQGGKNGAGLLRWKPNITWRKDRGKEPRSLRPQADFPWFWGCDPEKNLDHRQDFPGGPTFDGHRWNDLHYSLAVKRAAREEREVPA